MCCVKRRISIVEAEMNRVVGATWFGVERLGTGGGCLKTGDWRRVCRREGHFASQGEKRHHTAGNWGV